MPGFSNLSPAPRLRNLGKKKKKPGPQHSPGAEGVASEYLLFVDGHLSLPWHPRVG